MDLATEFESSTRQINSIIMAAVPSPNYQGDLTTLNPFEKQRDQIINHLEDSYNSQTLEMVQTKEQTDIANNVRRQVNKSENEHRAVQSKVENAEINLKKSKEILQHQLAKQQIVINLFWVLGSTLLVYIFLKSSPYVHVLALIVLVVGFAYVLQNKNLRLSLVPLKSLISSLDWNTTPSFDSSKWTSTIQGQ